ncbi:hypothetical protein ACLX1H_007955 [Fusarium chlamydosporum]
MASDLNSDILYRVKLDVAKRRLARWGAGIDVNNDLRFDCRDPEDETVALTEAILDILVTKFELIRKLSKRYETYSELQASG